MHDSLMWQGKFKEDPYNPCVVDVRHELFYIHVDMGMRVILSPFGHI